MQKPTVRYQVSDGDHVVGSFRTLKAARYYLANSTIIRLDGTKVPLASDGFKIHKQIS